MLKIILITTLVLTTVLADGDFVVLHSPSSLDITGDEPINQSLLKEVFTGVLGYNVKPHDWKGVFIRNYFDLPEAVVSIVIEGVDSVISPSGTRFPLNVDELEETTWQAVCRVVEGSSINNTLVRICVGDGLEALGQSALGELNPNSIETPKLKYLDMKIDEDRKFIEEVQLLRAIAKKIPSAITTNSRPDVYWFVVSGLRPVMDFHLESPLAVEEALYILNKALNNISNAFIDAYNGKVFIAAFTSDANQVRNTRSVENSRVRRQEPQAASSTEASKESAAPIELIKNEETEKDENISMETTESSKNVVNENTSEKENISSEPSNINEITELPGLELNHREHEVHSMTDSEVIKKPIQIENANLAKKYSANYPVMFNIFLWFGVTFLFSLIAICIAIAEMDPGRDSIIYRMTSNRMKKDN